MIMATYETFAAVYDAVMDDSLYDKWTDFSLRHLPKTKERKKLLELACANAGGKNPSIYRINYHP